MTNNECNQTHYKRKYESNRPKKFSIDFFLFRRRVRNRYTDLMKEQTVQPLHQTYRNHFNEISQIVEIVDDAVKQNIIFYLFWQRHSHCDANF